MARRRSTSQKLWLSMLHALFVISIIIGLQYIGNIQLDEIAFFKLFGIVEHNILGLDKKPVKDSLVFLDISKDQVMVDDTGMNYGKIHVTDHEMLAKFFTILNQHKGAYKAVLCDVGFSVPAPGDTLLKAQFERAAGVYAFLQMKGDKRVKPLFKGNYGAAEYTVNGGDFIKYPLFYDDSTKSLPTIMAEGVGKTYSHHYGLTYENGHLTFNTFIPELYYRMKDLDSAAKGKANLFHLGEMIDRPDFFDSLLKDKYILVGDFYNDRHGTYLGTLPGTLIAFNGFLTLRDHPVAISAVWLLILFLTFTPVSYYIFFAPKKNIAKIADEVKLAPLRKFLVKYLSFLGLMLVLNLVSYRIYGVFTSFFFIATYLTFLRSIVRRFVAFRQSDDIAEIFDDQHE